MLACPCRLVGVRVCFAFSPGVEELLEYLQYDPFGFPSGEGNDTYYTADFVVQNTMLKRSLRALVTPKLTGRKLYPNGRFFTVSATGIKPIPKIRSKGRKILAFGAVINVAAIACVIGVRELAVKDRLAMGEEAFPLVYDGEALEFFWQQHKLIVVNRVREVALTSLPLLVKIAAVFMKNYVLSLCENTVEHEDKEDEQRQLAIQLRELLVALGPSFIKLGQVLSTRPDFFPGPVLAELQQLCDAVPPFPTQQALDVIEKELGQPIDTVFEGINKDSVPVAAASLGQVYKCKLKNQNKRGESELVEIALKVQRPDMISAVSLDLYVIRMCMHSLEGIKGLLMNLGILAERKQFNVAMFDAFARASYSEVDYEHEATNQEVFAQKMSAAGMEKVYIPVVYRKGTKRRILSTEWIDGEQLSKSEPKVIKDLIEVGVECFLAQLLDMGFFHGDPREYFFSSLYCL